MATPRELGDPRDEAEAKQACWALLMLTALPEHIADDALPVHVRSACSESFFMNARALVEFLVLKDHPKRIHRHDYLPGWDPSDGREARELRSRWYGYASTHVAHLLLRRIPETYDPIENVTPERLRLLAEDVLLIADEFVAALRDTGGGWLPLFSRAVADARAQL